MTNWRKPKQLLFYLITLAVLVGSFAFLMPDLVFGQGSQPTNHKIFFPIILNDYVPPQPTPPPPPPQATVYIINDLGVNMTFEMLNTGIGIKTIPPGTHLYGSFPAGTYTYEARASGAYLKKTSYYSTGITEITFYWD